MLLFNRRWHELRRRRRLVELFGEFICFYCSRLLPRHHRLRVAVVIDLGQVDVCVVLLSEEVGLSL